MDAHKKGGQQGHGDGAAHQYAVGQGGTGPGEIAAGGDADGDIVGQVGVGQGAEADEVEPGGLDDSVLAVGALSDALAVELVEGDGAVEGRIEGLGCAAGEIAVHGGLCGACGAGSTGRGDVKRKVAINPQTMGNYKKIKSITLRMEPSGTTWAAFLRGQAGKEEIY